jgi:thiol-disulfide isomerase/thioredoxin
MEDFSYGGRRGGHYGPNATGETVGLDQFAGRFVWVDYSAPWCGPCVRQAPIVRKVEHDYAGKAVFLTVITSERDPRSPATTHTAQRWANQHKLDPTHVIASDEGARYIPTHIVFSPMGQTLYFKSGVHSETQIRAQMDHAIRTWDRWYAENKNSVSVMLGEIGNAGE